MKSISRTLIALMVLSVMPASGWGGTADYGISKDFDGSSCTAQFKEMRAKGINRVMLENDFNQMDRDRNAYVDKAHNQSLLFAAGGTILALSGPIGWATAAGVVITAAGVGRAIYAWNEINHKRDPKLKCLAYAIDSKMNFNVDVSANPAISANLKKGNIAASGSGAASDAHEQGSHSASQLK